MEDIVRLFIQITSLTVFILILFLLLRHRVCKKDVPLIVTPTLNKTEQIPYGTIFLFFLITRSLIFLTAYWGYHLTANENPGFIHIFNTVWNRWDSPHYLKIAQFGYVHGTDHDFIIGFFPLYPFLVKIFQPLFNNYLFAGVCISNASLYIACCVLYKLVRIDYSAAAALRSVLFLLIFPFSFFLSIGYSESLFLTLTLLSIYNMRRNKWFWAAYFGMFSFAARPAAIPLLILFIIEYAQSKNVQITWQKRQWSELNRHVFKCLGGTGLIIAGCLPYLIINKLTFNDWLAFKTFQQEYWSHHLILFSDNLADMVKHAYIYSPKDSVSLWIPSLVFFYAVILILCFGIRNCRWSYSVYLTVYVFLSYSFYWLLSGPRYLAAAFPLPILTALLAKNKNIETLVTIAYAMLLALYSFMFSKGSYLM